jgi:phenylpropionate dioxygenase-like ring-hydroxylating dioxygenase large terminal subunit
MVKVIDPRKPATVAACDPENWFIAARSDQVKRRPLRRLILERPLVLFRDSDGGVAVLEDRCPHKQVALSLGRVVGDSIECPYHGLCFDAGGRCTAQPSRASGEQLPKHRVPCFPAVEQDDWIWVYLGSNSPPPPPRHEKLQGYGWFELHNVMAASMDLVLDNGLDCSHTGIAHRGLFRSYPSQLVTSRIEQTATGIRVETIGERATGKLDASALAGRGALIEHVDTFIWPHTVRVDYRFGRAHFVTILVCTPETASRTRVYTRQGVRMPPVTTLATLVSNLVTRRIVAQDRRILENQAAQIECFGRPSRPSANADAPTRWLRRALRAAARAPGAGEDTTPRTEEVRYTL